MSYQPISGTSKPAVAPRGDDIRLDDVAPTEKRKELSPSEAAELLHKKGVRRIGPYMVPRTMCSTVSATLATAFGIFRACQRARRYRQQRRNRDPLGVHGHSLSFPTQCGRAATGLQTRWQSWVPFHLG